MLYLGRLLSGITGATGAVAASVIADTTSASQRVKWFGWLGASFGLGLIAGPIIGGFAGEISPHSPFFNRCVAKYCRFPCGYVLVP